MGAGVSTEGAPLSEVAIKNEIGVLYDAEKKKAFDAAVHWGVPCMVFDDETFYGQDRMDVLLWRMKQKGLKARA